MALWSVSVGLIIRIPSASSLYNRGSEQVDPYACPARGANAASKNTNKAVVITLTVGGTESEGDNQTP